MTIKKLINRINLTLNLSIFTRAFDIFSNKPGAARWLSSVLVWRR